MAGQSVNPQHQYLKTQIETATQPQLLLMLFDAAVKKLHISKKAIQNKEIEKAHTELTKVQRIFTELMLALDLELGGEMATNLMRIYDFIYHHLVKANIRQDAAMVDEVLPIVETLRDTWVQAVDKYNQEQESASLPSAKGKTIQLPHTQVNHQNMLDTASKPVVGSLPKPVPVNTAYRPAAAVPVKPAGAAESDAPRPRLNLRG